MIQLIGPGGAGKSTVGAMLAGRLGVPFGDLDREFERLHGDIDAFIAARGYEEYAGVNVSVYVELVRRLKGSVLALSSGFMVYPLSVHATYSTMAAAIASGPFTVVLLPSFDREVCAAETVRRQLSRSISHRTAAREEAVIQERFDYYMSFPAAKVETMRPASEVVDAICAKLALDVPEGFAAAG